MSGAPGRGLSPRVDPRSAFGLRARYHATHRVDFDASNEMSASDAAAASPKDRRLLFGGLLVTSS